MSILNCAEAIQAVLDGAMNRFEDLMMIYVDSIEEEQAAFSGRRLTLPWAEDAQIRFALGCAQAGILPVLDLRAVKGAEELIAQTLDEIDPTLSGSMIVRLCARRCPYMNNACVIEPADAREAAGAARYALSAKGVSIIVENPLASYETCEAEEDGDLLFDGRWLDASEIEKADDPSEINAEAAPDDETAAIGTTEETAEIELEVKAEAEPIETEISAPEETDEELPAEENPDVPSEGSAEETAAEEICPPIMTRMASRCRPYDAAELLRTAALLNISREELTRLCLKKAAQMAEVIVETDSEPGEAAFIPPTDASACLWIGSDRLTLCWKTDRLNPGEARDLLKDAAAMLELPVRLILDGKD